MPWFDIGSNLLDPRFDLQHELADSHAHDLEKICVISSDISESLKAQSLCSHHDCLVFTAGVHPHYADHVGDADWQDFEDILMAKRLSAVGECGLDFNRNFSTPDNQLRVFEQQLQGAKAHQIGVYLHERDAFSEQINLLEKYASDLPFMITHCFTGDIEQLKVYLDLGCYIGITGWLCDEKRGASLRNAVQALPLDRLLLETDAPYLFPKTVRPRQKNNSSRYISDIAKELSHLTDFSFEQIKDASFKNACRLLL